MEAVWGRWSKIMAVWIPIVRCISHRSAIKVEAGHWTNVCTKGDHGRETACTMSHIVRSAIGNWHAGRGCDTSRVWRCGGRGSRTVKTAEVNAAIAEMWLMHMRRSVGNWRSWAPRHVTIDRDAQRPTAGLKRRWHLVSSRRDRRERARLVGELRDRGMNYEEAVNT